MQQAAGEKEEELRRQLREAEGRLQAQMAALEAENSELKR